jgi:exopolysaccharide biosynthesis polyprenyl glycosylphosphotransferase
MFQQQVYIINNILIGMDALSIVIAGYFAFTIKSFIVDYNFKMDHTVFVLSILSVVVFNVYVMGKFNLYSDKKPASKLRLLKTILMAVFIDFLLLSSGIMLFKQVDYSRSFLLIFAAMCFFTISTARMLIEFYIGSFSRNNFQVWKILIVSETDKKEFLTKLFEEQLSFGHKIVGTISLTDNSEGGKTEKILNDLPEILRKYEIDEVVFALSSDRAVHLGDYLSICKQMGILVRILPSLWEPGKNALSIERCQKVPFLTIGTNNINATGMLYKRALDIVGGLIGSVITIILYPFVGLAIKLDSPGPVIFKQKRVSRNGRIFNLLKFRSMCQNAEELKKNLSLQNEMNGAMFKVDKDPRVTRVGKWLRKTSLDEFPQFFNVLKGEMSLVGTRPPTPEEVEIYLPQHLKRISIKPGITGLWQVSGRNLIKDFDKVVELDLKYLENWRFLDDIKIIFKTLFVVLKRKGAF